MSIDTTSRYVAVGAVSGPIDVWELDGLRRKATFSYADSNGQTVSVTKLAFSPDGKRLLTCGMDLSIRIWDWEKGQVVNRLDQDVATGFPTAIAFSPDGLYYVIGNMSDKTPNNVRVVRVEGNKEVSRFLGHSAGISCVAVAPDNRRVVSGSQDGTVRVSDLRSATEFVAFKKHNGIVYSVAVSADGKWVLSGADDKVVRLWELDTGREVHRFEGNEAGVTSVGFLRDSRYAFSSAADNTVRIWRLPPADSQAPPSADQDTTKSQDTVTLKEHTDYVSSVAWSIDGKQIASGGLGGDQTVKIWNATTGQCTFTFKEQRSITSVAWSPDSKRVVSGSADGPVKVWEAKTGHVTLRVNPHSKRVSSLAWSRDGERIASASHDGTLKVWDATTGQESFTLKGHTDYVKSVAWSRDGKQIVTGSNDGSVKVWDATTGKETLSLPGYAADWSPDGKRIVVSIADNTMKVWDATTGREGATLKGHKKSVTCVAWSPDGSQIASGSWDNTVKVWDATTGKENLTLEGHTDKVNSVAWSPDGKRLVSGSNDLTVKVWKVEGREPASKPDTKPIVRKTDTRLAVPDAAALAAAEQEVKETYEADFAKREREDLMKLAGRLYADASNMKNKPAAIRYVLCREARDLGAKAGDFRFSMLVAEGMAKIFAVDAWEMKADALEQADSKAVNVEGTREVKELAAKVYHRNAASYASAIADAATEQDAYGPAERLARAAQLNATAARDPNLTAVIPAQFKEFAALRKAYEPVPIALNTLASHPDDPDANLEVGKFYALAKGDWDRGLPRLAVGSDAKLKDLATSDLKCGPDADAMAELADRYSDQAEKAEGATKTHFLWRASYWYERAEGLYNKGPSRTKVATRKTAIEKVLPHARPVVLYARYGAPGGWADPTVNLRRLLLLSGLQKLTFLGGICPVLEIPEPAKGERKSLIIVYRFRGRVRLSMTGDADTVNLTGSTGIADAEPVRAEPGQELTILNARYGIEGSYDDVASKLQAAVKGSALNAKITDLNLGDPAPGKRKWLIVVVRHDGRVYFNTSTDDQPIILGPPPAER
jgi:WD40 repeat protein